MHPTHAPQRERGAYRTARRGLQSRGESFAANYECDFVHQSFRFSRFRGAGAQLREFGEQAWMRGEMDIWGKRRRRSGHDEDEVVMRFGTEKVNAVH